MDHQQLFYSSQSLLDPNDAFDPIIGSFDQGFDDFMFPDASFIDNVFDSGMVLPLEAVVILEAEEEKEEESRERNSGGGTSSGTSTKPKRDRSKTLVSERTRRSRMKEKLYELRSLVPNITKMDKSSIIGDAVVYLQSLQNQAKKLADEISVLESSSPNKGQSFGVPVRILEAKQAEDHCNKNQLCQGKILGVVAHEVGEGRFYVRVECSKGDGAVSALYSAIESLECFHVESSNLSFASDRFVLTLSLNVRVRGSGEVMAASSMKLWVMGALLKEGFGFEMQSK